jgi:hypothetical protein
MQLKSSVGWGDNVFNLLKWLKGIPDHQGYYGRIYENVEIMGAPDPNFVSIRLSNSVDSKDISGYVFRSLSQAEDFFKKGLDIVRFKIMSVNQVQKETPPEVLKILH